jgi:hypothetical protein
LLAAAKKMMSFLRAAQGLVMAHSVAVLLFQ